MRIPSALFLCFGTGVGMDVGQGSRSAFASRLAGNGYRYGRGRDDVAMRASIVENALFTGDACVTFVREEISDKGAQKNPTLGRVRYRC